MCGRARLGPRAITVAKRINPSLVIETVENLHPGLCVPVIMKHPTKKGEQTVEMMPWGLISSATQPPKAKIDHFLMFNARAESVMSRKSFAKLMHSKRCVVALDGFYEWKTLADGKQPYYITPNDDSCMYFAALWDAYSTKDGVLHTCTILSRESSDQMKWLHDRQPITLSEEAIEQWIDSAIHPLQILATTNDLFTTCPPRLVFTPVSRCMNKISYQQSDCTTMVEFDEIPKSSVARFFVMESGKASNMETLPSTPNRSPATNGMKRKLDSGSSQKSKTVGGAKSPSRQLSMDAFISR